MKNKHPRPSKGQVPDPTYSRMKFAYCTDRADSDGRVTGKKKPSSGGPRAILSKILFLPPTLHCRQTLQSENATKVWESVD